MACRDEEVEVGERKTWRLPSSTGSREFSEEQAWGPSAGPVLVACDST